MKPGVSQFIPPDETIDMPPVISSSSGVDRENRQSGIGAEGHFSGQDGDAKVASNNIMTSFLYYL